MPVKSLKTLAAEKTFHPARIDAETLKTATKLLESLHEKRFMSSEDNRQITLLLQCQTLEHLFNLLLPEYLTSNSVALLSHEYDQFQQDLLSQALNQNSVLSDMLSLSFYLIEDYLSKDDSVKLKEHLQDRIETLTGRIESRRKTLTEIQTQFADALLFAASQTDKTKLCAALTQLGTLSHDREFHAYTETQKTEPLMIGNILPPLFFEEPVLLIDDKDSEDSEESDIKSPDHIAHQAICRAYAETQKNIRQSLQKYMAQHKEQPEKMMHCTIACIQALTIPQTSEKERKKIISALLSILGNTKDLDLNAFIVAIIKTDPFALQLIDQIVTFIQQSKSPKTYRKHLELIFPTELSPRLIAEPEPHAESIEMLLSVRKSIINIIIGNGNPNAPITIKTTSTTMDLLPLHALARLDLPLLAKALTAAGAKPNQLDQSKQNGWHHLFVDSLEMADFFITHHVPHEQASKEGNTGLHALTTFGNLLVLQQLHEIFPSLNFNAKNNSGFSPLHAAIVSQHPNLEMIQYLLEHGANPSQIIQSKTTKSKKTTLVFAVLVSNPDILRLLLCYPEIRKQLSQSVEGITPLKAAVMHGCCVENIAILLEAGADPLEESHAALLSCALKNETPEERSAATLIVIQSLIQLHKIKELLTIVNTTYVEDRYFLEMAIQLDLHEEVIKMLLANGATLHPNNKLSLWEYAAQAQKWDLAKTFMPEESAANALHLLINAESWRAILVLANQTNINTFNDEGLTPLHRLLQEREFTLAKFLLKKGANPHLPSKTQDPCYPIHYLLPEFPANPKISAISLDKYSFTLGEYTKQLDDTCSMIVAFQEAGANEAITKSIVSLYVAEIKAVANAEHARLTKPLPIFNEKDAEKNAELFIRAQYSIEKITKQLSEIEKLLKKLTKATHTKASDKVNVPEPIFHLSLFIPTGKDPMHTDEEDNNQLHRLTDQNLHYFLKILLESIELSDHQKLTLLEQRNQNGHTPLDLALLNFHPECAEIIFDAMGRLKSKIPSSTLFSAPSEQRDGQNILSKMIGEFEPAHLEAFDKLLKRAHLKNLLNKPDEETAKPLFYAAYQDSRALVELLISHGAEPDLAILQLIFATLCDITEPDYSSREKSDETAGKYDEFLVHAKIFNTQVSASLDLFSTDAVRSHEQFSEVINSTLMRLEIIAGWYAKTPKEIALFNEVTAKISQLAKPQSLTPKNLH